jgi:hypothetical protein
VSECLCRSGRDGGSIPSEAGQRADWLVVLSTGRLYFCSGSADGEESGKMKARDLDEHRILRNRVLKARIIFLQFSAR